VNFLFLVLVTFTSNSFNSYLIRGEFLSVVSIAPLYHKIIGYDFLSLLQKKISCKFLSEIYLFVLYEMCVLHLAKSGPGSSVGIATVYGLDDPGIESWWGRYFPNLCRPALESNQIPVKCVPVLSGGKERPGRDADPLPFSSAVGHERVELYLYSH
jgi:hypothetical protein